MHRVVLVHGLLCSYSLRCKAATTLGTAARMLGIIFVCVQLPAWHFRSICSGRAPFKCRIDLDAMLHA